MKSRISFFKLLPFAASLILLYYHHRRQKASSKDQEV